METRTTPTLALVDAHSGVQAILAIKREATTPHFYLKTEVFVAALAPFVQEGWMRPLEECDCWTSARSAKTALGLTELQSLYLEIAQTNRHNATARGEFWQANQGDFLLFITDGEDYGRTTDYLLSQKVSLVFVGAALPIGIAGGLQQVLDSPSLATGSGGETLSREKLVSLVFASANLPEGLADGLRGLNWDLLSPNGSGENLSKQGLNGHISRWLRLDNHLLTS